MNKIYVKLLFLLLLIILSCSGQSNEIIQTQKKAPTQESKEITKQEKASVSQTQEKTKKPSSELNKTQVKPQIKSQEKKDGDKPGSQIIIVDFISDKYSRGCMVDTLGPEITFEIYQSKKIQQNETEKITGCLLTSSDNISKSNNKENIVKDAKEQKADDNKIKFIRFEPNKYSRECIVDTLGIQETEDIYILNEIESKLITRITQCLSDANNSNDDNSKASKNSNDDNLRASKDNQQKESIDQLIQRLYLPKVQITQKKLIKDNKSCDIVEDSKKLHINNNYSWKAIPLISGEVADFTVSKTNSSVIYLGIQENAHSIYKSVDGGKNWDRIHSFDHTKSLDIHPSDPDIFVYGDTQQIWLTEDGKNFSKSFQSRYPAGPHRTSFSSIAFSPSDPSIVLASIRGKNKESGGELYVSKDGGKSFKELKIKLPNIYVLLFDPRNSSKIYFGTNDGIYVTNDFFKSFEKLLNLNGVTSMETSDGDKVLVTSVDGIHISYDSGENWINGEGLDNTVFLRVKEIYDNQNILWATTSKGIARSDNGGKNWKLKHPNNIPTNVKALAVFPDDPNKIIVSTDTFQFDVRMDALYRSGLMKNQGIYVTYDNGDSWSLSVDGIYADEIETIETSPVNQDELWAGQQAGRGFYKSTDGGENWQLFSSWLSHYPMQIKYFPGYSNGLVASSNMYYSAMGFSYDSGNTWNLLSASTFLDLASKGVNSTKDSFVKLLVSKSRKEGEPKGSIHLHGLAINPKNVDEIYVGSVSDPSVWTDVALKGVHLYKSKDGGITWKIIGNGLPFYSESSIRDIQISYTDPKVLYLGLSHLEALEGNGIWKSVDSGENWVRANKGMPDDTSVHSLYIHPQNKDMVIAGTGNGLYVTNNGGELWVQKLPNDIKDVVSVITDPDVVYIIGNRGAWVSTDFGENWKLITNDSVHQNRPKGNIADNFYKEYLIGKQQVQNPSPIRGSTISVNCNGSKVYIGLNHYGILKAE